MFRWTITIATCFIASASYAQGPHVYGGAVHGPLWSTPGWFGPGPVLPRNYPGNSLDWQYYGVTGGPGLGFAGPNWPFFWGIPGAAGSNYTNGLSLYGPPVPTYTPTPGVFGAADNYKTFFRNPPPANGVFVGLGWGGYRSPSPRGQPLSVSVNPPSVAVVQAPTVVNSAGQPCMRVIVRVPDPDAEVWIDNKATTQKGAERLFESPPLPVGQRYRYELVARWTVNGQEKAESRTINGEVGQTVAVDFRLPKD
jgi:uncharacterized protein (TIGR03000 family)